MAESSRSRENKSHEAEALNDCNKIKRKNTRGQRLSIDDGSCRINRIDKLNEKIANLSNWLDDFSPTKLYSGLVLNKKTSSNLVINNGVGNFMESNSVGSCASNGTIGSKRSVKNLSPAESKKDLEQFAGIYSLKMVFASPSGNLTQVGSVPRVRKSFGNVSKRPMLVELHSFPGFDEDMITPLPLPLKPTDIIQIVISAQLGLKSKPTFKRDFENFFYSDLSQSVLSDTFWWFFCDKYQPTPASQEQLFNRIAQNYTKLLIRWSGSKYQDVLFKNYADLLAQSVYTTFCQAFPTSYRQFDDRFKDDLIYLVNQWITGTRPAPRTFEKWNFSELEPKDMRKGDQLYLGSSGSASKFDFEAHLNSKTLRSPNKSASAKHDDSSGHSTMARGRKISKVSPRPATRQDTFQLPVLNDPERIVVFSPTVQLPSRINIEKNAGEKRNGDDASKLQGKVSMHLMPKAASKKESCKAGRGPEFCKNVFDVYGKSPLIDQYLRSNNSASDCGTGVLVRRTEIKRLPSLSYDDIIKGTQKSSRVLKKRYRRSMDESSNERLKISKKQMVVQKEMERKTEELMSNPSLVKKISDILLLSLLRDEPDSIGPSPQDISNDLAKALQTAQFNPP